MDAFNRLREDPRWNLHNQGPREGTSCVQTRQSPWIKHGVLTTVHRAQHSASTLEGNWKTTSEFTISLMEGWLVVQQVRIFLCQFYLFEYLILFLFLSNSNSVYSQTLIILLTIVDRKMIRKFWILSFFSN